MAKQRKRAFSLPRRICILDGICVRARFLGAGQGARLAFRSRCQAGRTELHEVHQPHFPHSPPAQEVDPSKACWERPAQWYLPLPGRPYPDIWPWPRTQGPAFACCRRRKVGWYWEGQEMGWACLWQGFWPLRLCAQSVSKPWNVRNPSPWQGPGSILHTQGQPASLQCLTGPAALPYLNLLLSLS